MESSGPSAGAYEQERREKREKLRQMGMDPYGKRTSGVLSLTAIREKYAPEMGHDGGPAVKGAGRVVLKRDFGKLSFITLRDETGDLQVGLDKKRLGDEAWEVVGLIDLGDLIVVEGALGTTKKGEVTIWAALVEMASKALLPPPAKWEGLSDVELRYRQRYVDLWANPDVMRMMKLRVRIVEEVRRFMAGRGFTEVETPMMQTLAGGAAARPFVTKHNALGIPLFMRIAPELYLKRLLVGGFTKVYEINRNFRNEGISPRHNPEFTMLEAYEAFGSWETMAELVESMICHVAETVFGGLRIVHRKKSTTEGTEDTERVIDLSRPWRRVRMVDLVEEQTQAGWSQKGLSPDQCVKMGRLFEGRLYKATEKDTTGGRAIANEGSDPESIAGRFVNRLATLSPAEQLQEVYEKLIEPTLIDPTFVTHVPSVIIPLARKAKDNPFFADVYELAINGVEISPGYSELNDPDVQEENFRHQVGDEEEKQKVDEDFLTALKYGMPPAGGMGLGIDRLVMMLTGAESIRDVILFPLMKPKEEGTEARRHEGT